MAMEDNRNGQVKFYSPGIYKIEVQGRLDQSWSDRLAGMQITYAVKEKGFRVTTLVGHLRDQTQLSGVLNSLYELHLPILLVAYLKKINGAQAQGSGYHSNSLNEETVGRP